MMSMLSRIFWLTFVTILLVPFQNCSRANFKSSGSQSTTASGIETHENGTGYGGKVYVSSLRWGNLCSDSSVVSWRFTTANPGQAVMDREDCNPVTPYTISLTGPGTIDHYSEAIELPFDMYVYGERVYETAPPVTPLVPMFVSYVCTGFSGPLPVKVVIGETTVGATQFAGVASAVQGGGKQEFVMRNMSRTVLSATEKVYAGTDGAATYGFHINYGTAPHPATATYNGPSGNLNMILGCYLNF